MNDGVPGVVPSLAADDHVRFGGEHIDDFPFPLIAPLRADQNCVRHNLAGAKNFPTHPARRRTSPSARRTRRSRDLPTNDKKRKGRRKSLLETCFERR